MEGIAGIFDSEKNFRSDVQTLNLMGRKGFVRLALRTGAHLVPVYCFGNSDAFALATLPPWLALLSRKLRISLTFFHGRYGIPLPYPVKLTFAHGEAVSLSQVDEPSDAMVDEAHSRFVASLRAAFEATKMHAGYPSQQLEIR